MPDPKFILFSFVSHGNHGGHRLVGLVRTELEGSGLYLCEQQHFLNVDGKHSVFGEKKSDWWFYWTENAKMAHRVVLFDDEEYGDSDWCKKEKNFVAQNKQGKYIRVGHLMEANKSAKDIAQYIHEKC